MQQNTHPEYERKLENKYGNKFTLLSKYTNAKSNITVKCNECGMISDKQAVKLLYRGKCRSCFYEKQRKTHEEFENQIKTKYGKEFTLLGKYVYDKEKIKVRHNKCGAEYDIVASSLIQNGGCRFCQPQRIRKKFAKSHEQFVGDVKNKHGDNYTILGKYFNAQTKILIRHNDCGYEWEIKPISILLQLKSCPKCRHKRTKCKDPTTRQIVRNLRCQIIHLLRGRKKSAPTMMLIGCKSREELGQYIESKFQKGMSWDNYGMIWHIDHIRPCASFDLTRLTEQKECFHYTNLQPLWAVENMKKGSIYNGKRYYY